MLRLVRVHRSERYPRATSRCRSSARSSISTPRPGPVGQVQERRHAPRTRPRRSCPRTAPAWRARGRARRSSRRGRAPGRRAPRRRSRPARRGRSTGRRAARAAIPAAAPIPPTLASFTVASWQAPASRRPLAPPWRWSRSRRRRSGSRVAAAHRGHPLEVGGGLLGQLDPERLHRVAARPPPRRRSRRRWRRRGCCASGPDRLAHRLAPARRRRRIPTFSLKVSKPALPSAAASAATAVGAPATRVALQRTGAELAPSMRHTGIPEIRPARSKSAISTAAGRRGQPPPGRDVDHGVHRGGKWLLRGHRRHVEPGQSAWRARASDRSTRRGGRRAAPAAPPRRGRRARLGSQPQQDHLAALERPAGGHVGPLERERVGDRPRPRRSAWASGGDQQPGGEQDAEGGEQRAGAREGAVQGGPVASASSRRRSGRGASGAASRASSPQAGPSAASSVIGTVDEGGDDQQRVEAAGSLAAQPHREGHLSGPPVGVDVAHVVDDEDRGGEQADRRSRAPKGSQSSRSSWT